MVIDFVGVFLVEPMLSDTWQAFTIELVFDPFRQVSQVQEPILQVVLYWILNENLQIISIQWTLDQLKIIFN